MCKRATDLILSSIGLLFSSPILLSFMFLIKKHDGGDPLYRPLRAGINGKPFRMYKLRSMVNNADKTGVSSTSNTDSRITPIGKVIRKYKIDELMQLINVFRGEMSLVGPRPNLPSEIEGYSKEEMVLLTVKPGITDFSSIVFSDEGSILEGKENPDLSYNQLIRPWKSKLGLFYVTQRSFLLDIKLIFLTVINIFARNVALNAVSKTLKNLGAQEDLAEVAKRQIELSPAVVPGFTKIIGT